MVEPTFLATFSLDGVDTVLYCEVYYVDKAESGNRSTFRLKDKYNGVMVEDGLCVGIDIHFPESSETDRGVRAGSVKMLDRDAGTFVVVLDAT